MLACGGTATCLIGGATDNGDQAVVWARWRQWTPNRLRRALLDVMPASNAAFAGASRQPAGVTDPTTEAENLAKLANALATNMTATGSVAMHARGRQQRMLSAISDDWGTLHDDLVLTTDELKAGHDPSDDLLEYYNDVQALAAAERNAGYGPLGGGSASIPILT